MDAAHSVVSYEEGASRLARAGTLPREGWWHASDCLCELYRPASSQLQGPQTA
jgi:hypothetical protein